MKTNGWLLRLAAMACLACLAAVPPAQDATPASTPSSAATPVWVSPTPDETGAIVVIVQPGESLWVIAARAGLSLPELLALNDLSGSTVISPGDAIVIGHVAAVSLAHIIALRRLGDARVAIRSQIPMLVLMSTSRPWISNGSRSD